jgi:hypothetical protein
MLRRGEIGGEFEVRGRRCGLGGGSSKPAPFAKCAKGAAPKGHRAVEIFGWKGQALYGEMR